MGLNRQPCFGGGGSNVVEHGLIAAQGLGGPVFADFAEESMFNRIPLGSTRGIMSHPQTEAMRIAQLLLQGPFPHARTSAITAATISENEELVVSLVFGFIQPLPPLFQTGDRKGGRVIARTNKDTPFVGCLLYTSPSPRDRG